jgi:hypothetical protein
MQQPRLVLTLVAVLTSTALMGGPLDLHAQESPLRQAQWLVGCWERAGASRRFVERWFPPANQVMAGTAVALGDETRPGRETEKLKLYGSGDTLVYDAHPVSQARTLFQGVVSGRSPLTFENLQHDYPQRIIYAAVGSDSLRVRIEGDRDGRQGPRDFHFRKVDCGAVTGWPSPSSP